jgi:hypothetical protein
MALKWLDGFESYGTVVGNNVTIMLGSPRLKYLSDFGGNSNAQIEPGRLGGKSVQVGGVTLETPDFTAQTTWTTGFGFYFENRTVSQQIFLWKDTTTKQCSLSFEMNGELKFFRGDSTGGGTGLATSSGANLRSGSWNYIEVKVTIHNSTGTVDIKVNGVSVLSASGLNNRAGSNNQATRLCLHGSSNGGNNFRFDDWYVCDNQGSDNNTFLGPQKVSMILPTGDHGTNQWAATGAGSTHADRVKENPADSNTTYVSDAVSGDTEEWDYADTPSDLTSIKGIQVNTVFETDSATAFSLKNHVKSGGTSSDDAGAAGTNGTYTQTCFCLEQDPNTSALWTKANLDAALFGVKTV